MKKRIITVLMLLGMLGLMLGGCGQTSSESGTDSQDGEETTDPEALKFEEEGLTVTWWLVGDGDYYQTYWSEMKNMQAIQEITGISIEFVVATSYDDYLPMIAAGDYPDVITGYSYEKYPGRMPAMYEDGISVDLQQYIDEGYMPNFAQILEDYPTLAKDIRLDGGEYTYVSAFYDVNDEEDRMASSQYGLVLRQDWLDTVGLDVPTNMEEWYEVLSAFKTMDPNGNGEQDEVPLCLASSGWKYFLTAYGIDDDPSIMTDENGDSYVVFGYTTDAYKEFLEEFSKWYSEGLFGNMFEETSLEKQSEMVLNNLSGAWKGGVTNFDTDDPESFISQLQETTPDAARAAAPWPATEDGYVWCFSDINSFDRSTTCITDQAVANGTDRAAAYLIDYMLSEEGSNYIVWGIEGESYEIVDGEKQLMEGMDEQEVYEGSGAAMLVFNEYADPLTAVFPSFGEIADYILEGKSEDYINAMTIWSQGDTSYKMSRAIQLKQGQESSQEGDEKTMMNYIEKMRNYFITGTQPLTNYDTYLSNVSRMGGDDYTAVFQEAYEKYLAR